MKFIIHIGTHKTGSTLIQNICAKNSKNLRKYGICYPTDNYKNSGHHELAWAIRKKEHNIVDKLFSHILKKRGSCDRILLSSEDFEFVSDLSYLKEILNGHAVDVVVCLRRQDRYLESEYNEHVKNFNIRYSEDIFKFFMYHKFDARFNYKNLLDNWSNISSDKNVKILSYDNVINSGNLIQEFLKTSIGIECLDILTQDDLAIRSNVSINPVALIYLTRLNKERNISIDYFNRFVDVISNHSFPIKYKNNISFLGREFGSRLIKRYAITNNYVSDNYYSKKPLFNDMNIDQELVDYYNDFSIDLYNYFKRKAELMAP